MKLTNQKRLAAEILKAGKNRIWIDPGRIEDVEEVITREEIRRLISEGAIKKLPKRGVSRVRARIRHLKRRKGLRRGPGSRKGSKTSKISKKKMWSIRIRAIRKHLKQLLERRAIRRNTYRRLYLLAKGGVFENIRQVDQYIEAHRLTRRRSFG